VCGDARLPAEEIPTLLGSLVDKSLLTVDESAGLRYRMLETIREFGVEQLASRGEVHAARAAHARYFSGLVDEADRHLRRHDQLHWLALLEAERDNVLAALRFLGDSGEAEATVELALRLTWYWTLLGSHSEAANWLRFALAVPGPVPEGRRVMAEAAHTISSMAGESGDFDMAQVSRIMAEMDEKIAGVDLGSEPLAVLLRPILAVFSGDPVLVQQRMAEALECEDPWVRAAAHVMRANIAENEGDVETMRAAATTALDQFSAIGDRWGLAGTLATLGLVRMLDGELEGAVEAYEQAAQHLDELGAVGDSGMLKMRLSGVLVRLGRYDEALAALRQADEYARRSPLDETLLLIGELMIVMTMGDEQRMRVNVARLRQQMPATGRRPGQGHAHAIGLAVLADADLRLGDIEGARDGLAQSYAEGLGTHDMPILATIAVSVAQLAHALGLHRESAVLLGAGARLRGADDFTDRRITGLREELRAQLGADLDEAYAEGRALDRDEALARIDPERLAHARRR
jgi:tetratricopeptide (TPR) repeat protein